MRRTLTRRRTAAHARAWDVPVRWPASSSGSATCPPLQHKAATSWRLRGTQSTTGRSRPSPPTARSTSLRCTARYDVRRPAHVLQAGAVRSQCRRARVRAPLALLAGTTQLVTNDTHDVPVTPGVPQPVIWAVGQFGNGEYYKHRSDTRQVILLDFAAPCMPAEHRPALPAAAHPAQPHAPLVAHAHQPLLVRPHRSHLPPAPRSGVRLQRPRQRQCERVHEP